MSSTSPLRNRLPNVAPRVAQAALERARLTVVPRRRTQAARVPFVTFVSVILLAGVIGLLMFNTSMQQASFRETALQKQATDLGAQQEALEMELRLLNDPAHVATSAERLGMVLPTTAAGVLSLATGQISGEPQPASGADRLPIEQPAPARPGVLDPAPIRVKVPAANGAPAEVR